MSMRIEKISRLSSPTLVDVLYDILICVESIAAYSTLIVDGALELNQSDAAVVESRRGHFQIQLPMNGLVSRALGELQANSIDVRIEPVIVNRTYAVKTSGLKRSIEGIFHSGFLRFYIHGEAILKQIHPCHRKWGPNWRFGWAIRNAIAHDGKIKIKDQNTKPVEWDGLQFAHSDNGHPVLDQDVGSADLVALMIAMDAELRRDRHPHP